MRYHLINFVLPYFVISASLALYQKGKLVAKGMYLYTFSSNHIIHKSTCGLYFWASDPLDFTKIYKLKDN